MFNRGLGIIKNRRIDYNFEAINPKDFELTLTLEIDARIINYIWEKSKKKLLIDKGIDLSKHDPTIKKAFAVPDTFRSYIKVSTKKQVKDVIKIVKKDGIIVLDYNVRDCIYKLTDKKGWTVTIYYEGLYSKK